MTLIEAQNRYIQRVANCHPGHTRRVAVSARKQLFVWAEERGYAKTEIEALCRDAADMATLEANADD